MLRRSSDLLGALVGIAQQQLATLNQIKNTGDKTLAAIDDLNAEIVALGTSISNEITAATNAITAAAANGDSAAIETAVTNLKAAQAKIDAFTASLTPPASGGSAPAAA